MPRVHDIWVSSEMIDEVSDLAWLSKSLAAGLLHGLHRSARLSSGIEFSQYRPYVPGDDPRLIDLKMVAKTDRYYVKQATIETQHKVQFFIDDSASMNYSENSITKFHLAKLLIATISYILTQQGDQYGWSASNDAISVNTGMNHWKRSIAALSELEISDHEQSELFNSIHKGIVIWITDLYETLDTLKLKLNQFYSPNLETIVIHVSGKKEEQLDFNPNTTFIDLETNQSIETHTPSIKKDYQRNYNKHFREVKSMMHERGIFYHKIYLDDHLPQSLKAFFDTYNSIGN